MKILVTGGAGFIGGNFVHYMVDKYPEDMIVNLATANEDIVQNIQTISAITEEVTAHSSETMDSCRENVRIVSEVGEIATQLNQNAQELKAVQEA